MKDLSTARLLPAGDAPSPFGLHLVLGPLAGGSEEGPVPLPLSSDEGTSRVYLGALKGDADSIIELVAVKLLPNVLADSLAESAARPTNRTLLERFAAGARAAPLAPGGESLVPEAPPARRQSGGGAPGAPLRQAVPVVLRSALPDVRQAARAPDRRALPSGAPASVVPRDAAPARRLPLVRDDRPRHRRLLVPSPRRAVRRPGGGAGRAPQGACAGARPRLGRGSGEGVRLPRLRERRPCSSGRRGAPRSGISPRAGLLSPSARLRSS